MRGDTSLVAAALQLSILRQLAGAERLRLALEMSDLARELTRTRLRLTHSGWPEGRVSLELARLPNPLPDSVR